jgi:DnaA family protein
MKQLVLDLAPDASPTLDNFVAGPNAEVVQALRDLAAGARREPVVYLYGATGSGRTHLLQAVVASCAQGGSKYLSGTAGAALPEPLPDLVAWDDVHMLDDAGQARLFGLQIRLRESGGVLLCAGDVPPARLALRADVVTRLAAGVAYPLHVLADEDKAEAVARHAEQRGFRLGREVIEYLLRRHARDLPALIRMLEAIDRYSLETKRLVTVPLLRELFADART